MRAGLTVTAIAAVLGCGLTFAQSAQQDTALDVAQEVIDSFSVYQFNDTSPVFPAETVVDGIDWLDNLLQVDVTIDKADAEVNPEQLEALFEGINSHFACDPMFAGTVIRVRTSKTGEYRPLSDFLKIEYISDEPVIEEKPITAEPGESVVPVTRSMGVPTSHAGRQPAGALSGVTVYMTGGHGWTAGTYSWGLQRSSDLLEMNEDYGNLDFLNYLAHFAFNAGATVVPFRPVGYQNNEIVLDNTDTGVTFTGSWGINTTYPKYYGSDSNSRYRYAAASATETAVARYTPNIPEDGFYPIYTFVIPSSNRALQTYRIKHSGGTAEVAVDHREVGNGWVWLGEYYLEAGTDNYVEISNQTTAGSNVIADAIRWGNGMGDVWRSGPNSVSGYPRNAEAHRYWAHSELGINATGYDSDIWDIYSTDLSDNHGAAARWAAEMNVIPAGGVQDARWKRIYLACHTNAAGCSSGPPCSARGSVGLITSAATTNQAEFAHIISEEIDDDMTILVPEMEHDWNAARDTYTSGYGSISTTNNNNEFDATIIELAFHDNLQDAQLLRDCRVRAAMARSCVQAMIRFLSNSGTFSDTQVPLVFPPDTPRNVQVVNNGDGTVTLNWSAPVSDGARGGVATGYVIYESSNGYGFGNPTMPGNVLTATLSGPAAEETRYYRIAASNAGGESMPSEVLAVRRPASGTPKVLIVNGFDRLRRQQNPIMEFTFPAAYAGDTNERQQWRKANSFDYVIQHAQALAANDEGFDSCSNESVISSTIQLSNYDIVLWICGEESTEDSTFNASEQTKVSEFLNAGGALFVSGSEIAFDLDSQDNGRSFYENTLGADYIADTANTYNVSGTGIFSDVGNFDFDLANNAPYDVNSPDKIAPQAGGEAVLSYTGGSGGTAGVIYEHTGGLYRVVTLGFPFETITSSSTRNDLMGRVLLYLKGTIGPLPFDYDTDGDVDIDDFNVLYFCLSGPSVTFTSGHMCQAMDGVDDDVVDLKDFALFQSVYTGSLNP